MLFVETPLFTRRLAGRLSDDDYRGLQAHLSANPEAGVLVQRTGGARKLRWAEAGRGKSGGCRVLYYFDGAFTCYLLMLYHKSEASDLTEAQRVAIAHLIRDYLK